MKEIELQLVRDHRIKYFVLSLIIIQIMHFIEEYMTGFYRAISRCGCFKKYFLQCFKEYFFAFNILTVVFLLAAFTFIYKPQWNMKWLLLFALAEFWNGAHHILWCIVLGTYFPGACIRVTAIVPQCVYIQNIFHA